MTSHMGVSGCSWLFQDWCTSRWTSQDTSTCHILLRPGRHAWMHVPDSYGEIKEIRWPAQHGLLRLSAAMSRNLRMAPPVRSRGSRSHARNSAAGLESPFLLVWGLLLVLGLSARFAQAEATPAVTAAGMVDPPEGGMGEDLDLEGDYFSTLPVSIPDAGYHAGVDYRASIPDSLPWSKKSAGYYTNMPYKSATTAALLAALPGSSRYLMLERPRNKNHYLTASTLDLADGTAKALQPPTDHFCSGAVILPDGNPLLVGGHTGNKASGSKRVEDGRQYISIFDRKTDTFNRVATMKWKRWYPTPMRLDDRQVLIVGGTTETENGLWPLQGGEVPPLAEIWSGDSIKGSDPGTDGDNTTTLEMPQHFVDVAGWQWYPFLARLPGGAILWWGDIGGSITTGDFKKSIDLPEFPEGVTHHTAYPFTATPVMLALDYKTGYKPRMVIFGGAPWGADVKTPASSKALSIDFTPCKNNTVGYCPSEWQVEDMMGLRRVMGDSILLPNGKVLVLHGSQNGRAGYGLNNMPSRSSSPNTVSLLYDPEKPAGSRFTKLDPTNIVHMYHSTACLHHTGQVLVSGCDSCARYQGKPANVSQSPNGPLEYRVQLVTPSYIAEEVHRPAITVSPKTIKRGQTFTVNYAYNGTITGASLAMPCVSTHSVNMNQQIVKLQVKSAKGGKAVLVAPPTNLASIALKGWHILFLLGQDNTYSKGVWIQI